MTVTRRRFLAVLAGSAAALASPGARAAAVRWTGHALGARVSLTLVHGDRNAAWDATRAAVTACVDEIERLEDVFSLYRPQSALCRLNRHGALDDPGADLVQALSQARAVAEWTGGAFDPTMQPLWRLHAAGPPDPAALADTLTRVGHRGLSVAPRRVALARPGMAVSLNGIAQGIITDRVCDLLRRRGFGHALVDLGEQRATGPRDAAGAPWRLLGPAGRMLDLRGGAVATSAGSGTVFDATGLRHHLIDPRTGACANRYGSVTVAAPTAALADALSTALYVMAPAPARRLLAGRPDISAWATGLDGSRVAL